MIQTKNKDLLAQASIDRDHPVPAIPSFRDLIMAPLKNFANFEYVFSSIVYSNEPFYHLIYPLWHLFFHLVKNNF